MAWGERGPVGSVAGGVPLYPIPALLPSPVSPGGQQVPSRGHQTPPDSCVKPYPGAGGTPRPRTPTPLTFSTSWAARAPTTAATGHRSPALTLAKARTTSSSRGPCCAPRLHASSSTRSASACGQRDEGSPGQGGGGPGGSRQGQDGDSPAPWAGAGGPAPSGKHAGPGRRRVGYGYAAAPQDSPLVSWDLQAPGAGAPGGTVPGLGRAVPWGRGTARHGTARQCPNLGSSTAGLRGELT